MEYGLITVAVAIPQVRVADPEFNLRAIEDLVARADDMGVEVVCFPELSLTGYSCQDLFFTQQLISKADEVYTRARCHCHCGYAGGDRMPAAQLRSGGAAW